jgi:hypothetical protein
MVLGKFVACGLSPFSCGGGGGVGEECVAGGVPAGADVGEAKPANSSRRCPSQSASPTR